MNTTLQKAPLSNKRLSNKHLSLSNKHLSLINTSL